MVGTRAASKSSAASSPVPASPATPKANGHINGSANGHVIVKAKPGRKPNLSRSQSDAYAHVIDPLTILWLFVSLVLVFWDTCYIFLRPWSMPGGRVHSPIWTPYALYGTVDYIYGWPAWNDGVGFTAAQGFLNIIESAMVSICPILKLRLTLPAIRFGRF